MKWTLQRKAAVAVLALAGAAFCIDRFVLGYSATAAVGAAIGLAAPASTNSAPAVAFHLASLTQRVARLDPGDVSDEQIVLDAFAMPSRWKELDRAKDESTPKAAGGKPVRANFTLTTVITSVGDHPAVARINGRLVKVGERIDGRTLLRIEGGRSYTAVLSGSEPGDSDAGGDNGEIRVPLAVDNKALPADAPAPSLPRS